MLPPGLSRTPKCRLTLNDVNGGKLGRKEKWVDNVKEGNVLKDLGVSIRVTLHVNIISRNRMVGYGLD
jgi:hypothetical protein